jgi:hypothetical protein
VDARCDALHEALARRAVDPGSQIRARGVEVIAASLIPRICLSDWAESLPTCSTQVSVGCFYGYVLGVRLRPSGARRCAPPNAVRKGLCVLDRGFTLASDAKMFYRKYVRKKKSLDKTFVLYGIRGHPKCRCPQKRFSKMFSH